MGWCQCGLIVGEPVLLTPSPVPPPKDEEGGPPTLSSQHPASRRRLVLRLRCFVFAS